MSAMKKAMKQAARTRKMKVTEAAKQVIWPRKRESKRTVDRRNETRAKRKQENDVVEAFDGDGRSTKRNESVKERAKGRSTKRKGTQNENKRTTLRCGHARERTE